MASSVGLNRGSEIAPPVLDTGLEKPMNLPVISLDLSTQGTRSYWQAFTAMAITQVTNMLSWPWRKLTGQILSS